MEESEFLNFQEKVYEGVLEEKIAGKFSKIISDAISRAFTDTMKASFYANSQSFTMNMEDLKQLNIDEEFLMTYISSHDYPFVSFFLIKSKDLLILGDILGNREIGENQNLGEMEKSIALEMNNVVQGSTINSLSDIIEREISVNTPKYVTIFELDRVIEKFASSNNSDQVLFSKIDILSGGEVFAKVVFVFGQPMIESLKKMIRK